MDGLRCGMGGELRARMGGAGVPLLHLGAREERQEHRCTRGVESESAWSSSPVAWSSQVHFPINGRKHTIRLKLSGCNEKGVGVWQARQDTA